MTRDVEERFWSKVAITSEGCWEWQGALVDGYGQYSLGGTKRVRSHRYAYELRVGPVPKGLVLDHLCRNRACVRPDHLEPVTNRVNILRSPLTLAAQNVARTHCGEGHPLSGDNLLREADTSRGCKACRRRHGREHWVRTKAYRAEVAQIREIQREVLREMSI